ncbi:MAG: hypothetical protein R3246_02100 [Acidimicrobiia bacterium]|nr:hypothetical protein [Acidimicrobiia bacterium]
MRPLTLDRDLVDRLAGTSGEGLVSILMPTHEKGPETAQDRIRLKNAVSEIDDLMDAAGWRRPTREEQLAPLRELLDDEDFWAHQGHGLAVYVADGGDLTPVAVGEPVDMTMSVAPSYHLRHLLPPLERERLAALILTKGAVGMFEVDRLRANEMDVDLPRSMSDVNWFVDYESRINRHSDRKGSAGIQHGHDPTDRMHEDVERFLRAVDDALPTLDGPLAVLGDDPLVDAFSKVSSRQVIPLDLGGVDRSRWSTEVHRRVSEVIEERYRSRLTENREAAAEAMGTMDVATLFPEALSDAGTGRLSAVFVRRGTAPVWGTYDPETFEAHAVADRTVGTVDLVDRLVMVARSLGADICPMDDAVDGNDFVAVRRF